MKKSYIIALVGVIFTIIFTVIFVTTMFSDHIEDTNGSITDLETIAIADMLNINCDKYVTYLSSLRNYGNTTGVDGRIEDVDRDNIKFSAKKLSGIKIVQATYVEENQELSLQIENELLSGNLEIIIVAPDDTIIEFIDVNSKKTIEIKNTTEGIYRVVIGGESAELKIQIERNIE